jgi:hypothetical protein
MRRVPPGAPADRTTRSASRMPRFAARCLKGCRPQAGAPNPCNGRPLPVFVGLWDGDGAQFPVGARDGFGFIGWRETDSPSRAREICGRCTRRSTAPGMGSHRVPGERSSRSRDEFTGGGRKPSQRRTGERVRCGVDNSAGPAMQPYPGQRTRAPVWCARLTECPARSGHASRAHSMLDGRWRRGRCGGTSDPNTAVEALEQTRRRAARPVTDASPWDCGHMAPRRGSSISPNSSRSRPGRGLQNTLVLRAVPRILRRWQCAEARPLPRFDEDLENSSAFESVVPPRHGLEPV